ncbi:SGNH/GDSL hydrolase family protein [Glaciibacter sp. 2TAF33]|uniref:SGNH/GDSL hydrolase family protein n=1 Tax=Glaciibacter sp. 2TAF33 TaxID=3233015 RepID=UPI003F8E0DA2
MLNLSQFRVQFLSRLGVLSLVTAGLVVGVAATPAAASSATTSSVSSAHSSWSFNSAGNLVALGDSFTAGQGAPPYLPGPCLQSRFASYPGIAAALSPYRLAANNACSGARVADVPAQLAGASPSTKLVTLTIGGIDAGSNQVLQACAPDPTAPICLQAVAASAAQMAVLGPQLVGLYQGIATALPQARLVVLNYPRLFNPGVLPLGELVNTATDTLNQVIQGAVAAAANPRVTMVDVTQEFAGHGIGARVPYIAYNPADPLALVNFHPTALGNALGYARALANDGILRR